MFATVKLAATAMVLAVALALLPVPAWAVLVALVALLGFAVARDVRSAPAPRRLSPALEAPGSAEMGQDVAVSLTLRNPTHQPLDVGLHAAAPPSLQRRPTRIRTVLAAGEAAQLELRLTPGRRGYADLGPLTVRTLGPWGLAGRQATLPVTHRLKVYPPLPGRREVGSRLTGARLADARRRSIVPGGGGAFDSLREYHPDDELRRINWKATARSPRPISNVFSEERSQQVIVLLDAGRTMATNVAGVTRAEHAIDAAVTLTEVALRAGDRVGLMAFAAGVVGQLPPRSGTAQASRVLDLLFGVEASLEAAAYRKAFASVLTDHRRRALLVLLTDLAEPAAMESLFEAVPALVHRHLLIVGSIRDPDLVGRAQALPSSTEEAYLQAAAGAALMGRERAAAKLGSLGAVVIDREPGRLAGRLADEYLRIKVRGRL